MTPFEFIALCDDLLSKFSEIKPKTPDRYKEIYASARLKISDTQAAYAHAEYIRQKIAILHYSEGLDCFKYFPILDAIKEVVRTQPRPNTPLPEATEWEPLLEIIIRERSELIYFEAQPEKELESRLHNFAIAYLRLTRRGIEFSEENDEFTISSGSFELISREIDQLCKSYGGKNLISSLSELLGKTYNSTTGRFMEYRRVGMGTTRIGAAIPFGYLVSIVSKYVQYPGSGNFKVFEQLVELITDLIVAFEIQPYSWMEPLHLSTENLIEFLRKNILYDTFVGIAQTKASLASSLIDFINKEFQASSISSFGVKLEDAARVALALISLAQTKKFTTVRSKEISKKCRISEHKVTEAMDKLLSIQAGLVNARLDFPPKSLDIDHYFKPAIKNGNEYLLFPKSITSLGCLNTVCYTISHPNGEWCNPSDSQLGYSIEEFLRSAFRKKGIKVIHGDHLGKPKLEADLICEANNFIYVFEMKKKPLTREAQSGDEVKIFTDIANSLLASQAQAMKIENVLLSSGSLTLTRNCVNETISLNNRSVVKISTSLHDYGVLQDTTVLHRLLQISVSSTVQHHDSKINKNLRQWNDLSQNLNNLLLANKETDWRNPFYYSLFMSIPQIILALENSNNIDDFFEIIRSLIFVTTSTRNNYSELLYKLTREPKVKAATI